MGDSTFQHRIATMIRKTLTDPQATEAQREKVAQLARKLADSIKRWDAGFCYEWFYGACGLDHWGDLIEPAQAAS